MFASENWEQEEGQLDTPWGEYGEHWSAEAEVRNEEYPNGGLCLKERSWRGLQFDVCVNNIPWRNIE